MVVGPPSVRIDFRRELSKYFVNLVLVQQVSTPHQLVVLPTSVDRVDRRHMSTCDQPCRNVSSTVRYGLRSAHL